MPLLSIIVPTRERAAYVGAALATCLQSDEANIEVLVLDNVSTDNTADVVAAIRDPRLRYLRSARRLSMRDNFERGLDLAKGDYLCFIGDDDGILKPAIKSVFSLFERSEVDAIAAARAHFYWPDLLSNRRGTGLLPRGSGVEVRDGKTELRRVLETSDYYRLPCLYHGFVRRGVVDRIKARQGRFFLSSQVDMFSAIALSMDGISFAFSHAPLIINGGSARSNGASHFGGGTSEEAAKWKQEDELGFLPGFDNYATVGSLIVESAIRYGTANGLALDQILPDHAVARAMIAEREARLSRGLPLTDFGQALTAAGVNDRSGKGETSGGLQRVRRMIRAFAGSAPIDMQRQGANDVFDAARVMQKRLDKGWTRNLVDPIEQVRVATRVARG